MSATRIRRSATGLSGSHTPLLSSSRCSRTSPREVKLQADLLVELIHRADQVELELRLGKVEGGGTDVAQVARHDGQRVGVLHLCTARYDGETGFGPATGADNLYSSHKLPCRD